MEQYNVQKLDLDLAHLYRPSRLTTASPLLVLLHGYGSNKEDLFSFAQYLPEELSVLALEAPIALGPNSFAWYDIYFEPNQGKWSDADQGKKALTRITTNIESAIKQIDVDCSRISLLGFSQGSILSLALGLSNPDLIKNIIVLSGYINHDLMSLEADGSVKVVPNIFMSHGTQDQVIPVTWARESRDFLIKHKYSVDYHEFPVGHGVNPENFAAFKQFLAQYA